MKKNVASKIIAGALASAMVIGMVGCGGDDGSSQESSGSSTPDSSTSSGDTGSSDAGSSDAGNDSSDADTGSDAGDQQAQGPMTLTISLPAVNVDHSEADPTYDKLVAELNTRLNANITWEWGSMSTYYNQLGLKYAANDVADILVVGTDGGFFSAASGGSYDALMFDDNGEPIMQDVLDEEGNPVTDEEGNVVQEQVKETQTITEPIFWDLTDYIKDYDNLASIPQSVLDEMSYKGRVYCLPRSRTYARNGWGYRQDWLNNLGLKEPETWEEFKDMLYQFTYNDPDKNGQNDTVGLFIDSWTGVWDQMACWFGVPNVWGIDENGDLIHKSQTEEYKTALKEFRELYSQGVINNGTNGIADFRDVGAGRARDEGLRTGLGGVYVQVLDDARKIETYFEDNGLYGAVAGTTDPEELVFTLKGYVLTESGNNEPHILTAGAASNGIAISKTGNIKTEEDLKRALEILNELSDGDVINLIEYGWEGTTYEINEDGYVFLWMGNSENDEDGTRAKLDAAGVPSVNYRDGFNQVVTYFTAEENARPITVPPASTAITVLEQQLYAEDIPYVVPNMGAAFTSEYYVNHAAELDAIIADAQLAYIAGEIDDAGLEEALNRWWTAGGEQVTKEMNDLYHAQ